MADVDDARLAELRAQARYARERLQLYKARVYGGRELSRDRLRELERASDDAAERLRRAETRESPPRP